MYRLLSIALVSFGLLFLLGCGGGDCTKNKDCPNKSCTTDGCPNNSTVTSEPLLTVPERENIAPTPVNPGGDITANAPRSPGSSDLPGDNGSTNTNLDALKVQAQAISASHQDSSERNLFCKFTGSYSRGSILRTSKWGPVGMVQAELKLKVDGFLGDDTATKINEYKTANGLEANSCIDTKMWKKMFPGKRVPSRLERAIGLTFIMEGTDYDKIERNYGSRDHSGMTWGPLGMTLASKEIQEILKESLKRGGEQIRKTLSSDEMSLYKQVSEASLSSGSGLYFPKVKRLFIKLADIAVIRQVYDIVSVRAVYDKMSYYEKYLKDMAAYSKVTELDWALFFDVSTQTGSPKTKSNTLRASVPVNRSYSDLDERRKSMGVVIANKVSSAWRKDRLLRNSAFYGSKSFVARSYGFDDRALFSNVDKKTVPEESDELSVKTLEVSGD